MVPAGGVPQGANSACGFNATGTALGGEWSPVFTGSAPLASIPSLWEEFGVQVTVVTPGRQLQGLTFSLTNQCQSIKIQTNVAGLRKGVGSQGWEPWVEGGAGAETGKVWGVRVVR